LRLEKDGHTDVLINMAGLIRFGTRVGLGIVREVPPRANKFAEYFKAEMAPPSAHDWPLIKSEFNKLFVSFQQQKWKEMTVRKAWLQTLVGVEIACWFFAGEVIGRWNFVGYLIPWTAHRRDD